MHSKSRFLEKMRKYQFYLPIYRQCNHNARTWDNNWNRVKNNSNRVQTLYYHSNNKSTNTKTKSKSYNPPWTIPPNWFPLCRRASRSSKANGKVDTTKQWHKCSTLHMKLENKVNKFSSVFLRADSMCFWLKGSRRGMPSLTSIKGKSRRPIMLLKGWKRSWGWLRKLLRTERGFWRRKFLRRNKNVSNWEKNSWKKDNKYLKKFLPSKTEFSNLLRNTKKLFCS